MGHMTIAMMVLYFTETRDLQFFKGHIQMHCDLKSLLLPTVTTSVARLGRSSSRIEPRTPQ